MPTISKNIEKLLNNQIEKEMNSSQLYLAMSCWCEDQGLVGSSKFLYTHAQEEMQHAHKILKYVQEAGGVAVIPGIKEPAKKYASFKKVFEDAFKHEQDISSSINKIVEATLTAKDYTTFNFLQWFVSEQLEEENLFRSIIQKIGMVGEDKRGIYLVDKDLGKSIA